MDTKSKNFSYNRITKIVMFLIATALAINVSFIMVNSYEKYGTFSKYSYYQTRQLLQAYDREYNTDYYNQLINTEKELQEGVDSFEKINEIILDNNQHSVHALLGINIQQYVNKGIRYVMADSNNRVIGTDGITNKSINRDIYENRLSDNYWIDVREDNILSQEILENTKPNAELQNSDGQKRYEYLEESDDILYYINGYSFYVFYDDEVAQPIIEYKEEVNRAIQTSYINMFIYIGLFLLICIYFMLVAGKMSANSEINYTIFDKIPFDVLTVLVGCAIGGLIAIYVVLIEQLNYTNLTVSSELNSSIYVVLAILASSITIFYCSNFGKRIRNKELFSSCFIVVVIKKIFSAIYNKIIKPIYDLIAVNSSVSIIVVMVVMVVTLVISLYGIEVGNFAVVFMCSLIIIAIMLLLVVNSLRVNKAVQSIKNGESYKAKKSVLNYPYDTIFENLEDISENVSEVVQKNMTSQRTQVTLVTNVSHDLRTPLTSIIGYVDLLSKKADMYDEETQEYINVLKEKSDRMATMVEDLFDISKSASGDVILNKENLNVKKLVEQTLGELDDVIEYEDKIELHLVDDVCIFADGNKMYRVFQNTIENALKYSLDGTRIYITSEVIDDNKVRIEIKNIANYRMNFTGEEIVQRFKRGDESRTTKGSGLGLSIAQIFTNINGGDFDVVVDGDLFKVVIVFNINM